MASSVSGKVSARAKLRTPLMVSAVLAVFAVVVLSGALLIFAAMNNMADHANSLDAQRARQAAAGALASIEQQMASAISDYSAWDDAANAVYKAYDQDWLVKNYGVFSGASNLFDTFFLVTPDGQTAMGYQNGTPLAQSMDSFFGPSFDDMYQALREDIPKGTYQKTGFVRTSDGISVVGISVVRASDGRLTVAPANAAVVVFARHLTEAVIGQLARNYIIDGLQLISQEPAGRPYAAIRNPRGGLLGALVWNLREPGTRSYRQIMPQVETGLTVIGLVLLGLIGVGIVIVRRLSGEEKAARQLSKQDQLTGLLNRSGLYEAIHHIGRQAAVRDRDAVLIYLDLDRFKEVNDAYGHNVGDQLIRGVTAGLKYLLPADAAFARIGGDEFAIAFACEDAAACCRQIEEAIVGFFKEPLLIGDRLASVGASMGIAVSRRGALGGDELLRRADLAMYRAKAARTGRAVLYNPAMDEDRQARMVMANDLRIALDRNALDVVYQPVIDARTRRVSGVEALVRWNRNGQGAVPPDIFIPVAEDAGLIGRIGEFVMRRAFTDALHWPNINVAVNVSPLQLHDTSFVSSTLALIAKTGFPPERAIVEITEGFFVRNPERAKQSFFELRRAGLRIALDDFGSGFSSVGYLREFGFDRLKIDRSLIDALGKLPKAGDLLKATVALASSFDIPVTAEGIETDTQADFVTKCGCDELQGYYFSKPIKAAEMDALLAAPAVSIPAA